MANCFARVEFVKRSKGKNACLKSSYVSREKVVFHGSKFQEKQVYNFSHIEKAAYHEVLIPNHAKPHIKDPETLWNLCEKFEKRKDSQPAFEMVLALPDDEIITLKDRIYLLKTFVEKNFIAEGFAAEIAIHPPHKRGGKDHNWHAHILVSGRKISETGETLESHKPRDFFSRLSNTKWYLFWTQHQNEYFEEKGLPLRVDPIGAVPEKHLGPVRMRGHAMSLIIENETRKELNQTISADPKVVLDKITETKSIFIPKDLDRFLHKNVPPEKVNEVRQQFWKLPEVIELVDKCTGERTHRYTTRDIIEEEEKILRLADRIHNKSGILKAPQTAPFTKQLNKEQSEAFQNIIQGQRLSCIDGHAGTGKSHLLASLKNYYEYTGIRVRALGPDNATAKVLKSKGFEYSQNIYNFLFSKEYGHTKPRKSKEVWIVDESSKLGNKPLLELLKQAEKYNAQIIFSGSASQLSSVSRGGFFEIFCNRYGSQTLKNIQRQKYTHQLQMTQSIALGCVSSAINTLITNGGFHWTSSNEDSRKDLIKKWADDIRHFPVSTTLILARSNKDVKILNEMARSMRKELGQLGDTTYRCETASGTIFVSQGDMIEFRANDPNLGVTNGMTGILIKATAEKFTVRLTQERKSRDISFNPAEYPSYNLGYATSVYRSQGDTVERVYVCANPGFQIQELYVALTRHERDIHLYVPRDKVYTLSRLKQYWSQKDTSLMAIDFSTAEKYALKKQEESEKTRVQELIKSERFLDRMKGRGLSLLNRFDKKIDSFFESKTDTHSDPNFYKLNTPQKIEGKVSIDPEFYSEIENDLDLLHPKESNIPNQQKTTPDLTNHPIENNPTSPLSKILHEYNALIDKTTLSRLIALEESERQNKPVEQVPAFKEWQKACGTRNQKAHEIISKIEQDKISPPFGEKKLKIVQDQSAKHQNHLDSIHKNVISKKEISQKLAENIDALLFNLFPEGPTQKSRGKVRYGRKGSLCVTVSGSNQGTYFNFEENRGGGLIHLIAHQNNLSNEEAFQWAKDFLKISADIKVPKSYQAQKIAKTTKESVWISSKPPKEASKSIHNSLPPYFKEFEEKARYAYRDKNGDLLFYTIRLSDKKDSTSKSILPLSYGHWKNSPQKKWTFKQYASTNRPLYGLHLLYENPTKEVLIVEGEKAADAAKTHFPDHVCISWLGGSGAVSKTDWSPLIGREVLIWPDNDKAGFKAAEAISSELRKQGVKNLKVVEENQLAKFPEKWDLADKPPEGISKNDIQFIALTSKNKAIDPQRLLIEIGAKEYENPIAIAKANEVLWRVYERMEGELSEKHGGQENRVHLEILSISSKILSSKNSIEEILSQEFGIKGQLAERICHQSILKTAQTGHEATKTDLEHWKKQIQESKWICVLEQDLEKSGIDQKTKDFAISRSITQSLQHTKPLEKELKERARSFVESLKESQKIQIEIKKQQQKSLEKSNSLDLSL